jgi:hypothetical protein
MRPAILIFLFLLPGAAAPAAVPSPPIGTLAEAWQALANNRPDLALPQFERLAAQGRGDPRSVRFGTALSLLAQPTDLPNRVARARALLAALAADGSDDVALGARFQLARLAEFQADPPDPLSAAKIFRQLIAEHETSVWAQAALPRLAVLLLYTAAGPADPAQRVAAVAPLLGSARQPAVAVELRLIIADAIFHYRLPDALALPHLLAVEQTAELDVASRGDVLVQIGELSRLAGDGAQAARYYRTFLAEYPRDARQYAVRQRLAGLDGTKPAP